jgi:hypothetical protein
MDMTLVRIANKLLRRIYFHFFCWSCEHNVRVIDKINNTSYCCGSARSFIHLFDGMPQSELYILSSAIRHPNGMIFSATSPCKHHQLIRLMSRYGMAGVKNTRDQGFLTSDGHFVDRRIALEIATDAGQIIRKTSPKDKLFSEDMWITVASEGIVKTEYLGVC